MFGRRARDRSRWLLCRLFVGVGELTLAELLVCENAFFVGEGAVFEIVAGEGLIADVGCAGRLLHVRAGFVGLNGFCGGLTWI